VFDKDKNGTIDPDELMAILTDPKGGQPLTREQAKDVIARFDTNHDGVLDKEEFCNAIASDMVRPPPRGASSVPLTATTRTDRCRARCGRALTKLAAAIARAALPVATNVPSEPLLPSPPS